MGLSDDIKKINAELDKLRKELGKNPLKPFDEKDIDKAREALGGLRSEIREMNSDLDYVSKSFKDSVNELSRQNSYLTDARKSLSSISDISRKITDYRKGDSTLTEKQLKNLQQQAKTKFDSLKNDLRSGQLSKANAEEVKNALDQQQLFDKEVQRTIDHQKAVNKEIGLLGTGLSGAAKILSKMGFGDLSQPLQDAIDKTKNARLQQKLNNDELSSTQSQIDEIVKKEGLVLSEKQMQAGFGGKELKDLVNKKKSLESQNKLLDSQTSKYKNIGNALKDQLTKANLIDYVFKSLIEAFGTSQKGIGDLAKGLGMSATRATDMRQEFANIANLSMDANVNVKNLQEAQMAVGAALGTNAMLNEEDLITMAEIVKKTGLQYNELVKIEKLSLATGKSLEDNVEAALGGATAYAMQNKMVIDNNKVLREINNASDALKLSLGGSVEALGEAVVKVQQLGMDLKTAEQIASSMLNFESSIEAELEAELLTGKNLNMEKARQLALEGDIAGAAKEVADQLGNAEEFGKMNVIQQEALAKSVGMNRDQLAGMLIERQALEAMNAREGQSARERYDELVKEGHTRAEIQKMVGEEAMAQMEQQSAQEKFNAALEKAQEIFVQIMDAVAPIFEVLANIVTTIMPALNLAFEPIRIVVGAISDSLTWISDLIKESTAATIAFGSAFALLLGYQQRSFLIEKGSLVLKKAKSLFQTKEIAQEGLLSTIKSKGLLKTIGEAAMTAFKSAAAIPIVGPLLGAAAAATAVALGMKYMKDGVIGPGGEMVVSGPKGSIQLDKDDSIIAGTNLMGNGKKKEDKTTQQPTQTTQASVDMTQTNALLQQLISAVTTGGVVTLDGQKVGEALKIGSFQTQ